ncbi:esterase-like activity of phytase family protein [Streptomyces violens]|uniref:esterase-like activity of phytase family protein n=1 Tax=Streptomyces violens TaxID=66377 RepID=UPI0004C28C86|nr:esterase-like activity of phytase family protein [Streptomyces violens]
MRLATAIPAALAATLLVTGTLPATATATAAAAPPGPACSPRVSIDRYSDALDKRSVDGLYVGNFSALARDTDGDLLALSDRSALVTLDGRTREPLRGIPLADEGGKPLDSEGLVVEQDGSRLITSEVEPSVRRYDRAGHPTGRLPVPDGLRVAPAGRATANQTFEGLTAGPGGRTLTASMEGPLAGDGTDAQGRPLHRFQTWQRQPHGGYALGRQYAYPAEQGMTIPEITALDDGRLLVLERKFEPQGNTIRLYLADPRRADDTRDTGKLTGATRPAAKTLLADLTRCPSLGAPARQPQINPLLDNIEGVTVLGRTHGRLKLLLVSDDNQRAQQITRLYDMTVRL